MCIYIYIYTVLILLCYCYGYYSCCDCYRAGAAWSHEPGKAGAVMLAKVLTPGR